MGGKFKLLGLPCWGSLQARLQNWNCKDWSRWSHLAPAPHRVGVRKLYTVGQNALADGVAGHGGQVPAAELALLGLPAAQAAKLELQGMQQV